MAVSRAFEFVEFIELLELIEFIEFVEVLCFGKESRNTEPEACNLCSPNKLKYSL